MATPGLEPALTSLLQQRASDSSPNSALCSALRRAQYRHERFGYLSGREPSILHSPRGVQRQSDFCGAAAAPSTPPAPRCCALPAHRKRPILTCCSQLPSLNGSLVASACEPFCDDDFGPLPPRRRRGFRRCARDPRGGRALRRGARAGCGAAGVEAGGGPPPRRRRFHDEKLTSLCAFEEARALLVTW